MTCTKTEPWTLVVLAHDGSVDKIRDFFGRVWSDGIILIEAIGINQITSTEERVIQDTQPLSSLEGKVLTVYGDGCYHHYTYGLCMATACKKNKDYLYIHVDNHKDANKPEDRFLGCGSFVEELPKKPKAKDIIFLGAQYGSNDYNRTYVPQETISSEHARKILKNVLKEKPQKDVYASFDLDVMNRTEIITSYIQGTLELKHLLKIIEVIKDEKYIISADILGLSNRTRDDPKKEYLEPVSLLTYATLAAKITGKNTEELEELHRRFKTNKRVNVGDLKAFLKIKEEFRRLTEHLKI